MATNRNPVDKKPINDTISSNDNNKQGHRQNAPAPNTHENVPQFGGVVKHVEWTQLMVPVKKRNSPQSQHQPGPFISVTSPTDVRVLRERLVLYGGCRLLSTSVFN